MNSPEFNTILTDVGGVLIEEYDTTSDVQHRVGLDDATFNKVWPALITRYGSGSISEEDLWRQLADAGGKSVSTTPNFFRETFASHLKKHDKVLSRLSSLGRHGYMLGVLSNTIEPHSEVLRDANVYEPFGDHVYLSHEIHHRKPAPESYEYALERMGKSPSEVLYIDDKEANLLVPREMGMRTMIAMGGEDEIIAALNSNVFKNHLASH